MGFFDFLADMDLYAEKADTVPRMNARHSFLIEPFKEEIEGARVFDIASHDGRWTQALGYECIWLDWNSVPEEDRIGTWGYYRTTGKRRGTCALVPFD